MDDKCSADCDRPVYCKGLCKNCYYRIRYRTQHGIPLDLPVRGGRFCPKGHDKTLPDAVNKRGECSECVRAQKRKAYWVAPEIYKDLKLRKNYGISLEAYTDWYERQGGVCAICGGVSERALAVDHDHVTGRIRGLLCNNCNNGLGRFKDDPGRLKAAIRYLEDGGDPCPACNETDLKECGSKHLCPDCGYLQPCCNP